MQDLQHRWIVVKGTLGDVEHELRRREPGPVERIGDEAHEAAIGELLRRDVDGDRRGPAIGERGRPGGGLATGLAQHPRADPRDQARLLGDRKKARGRDEPPSRVRPAHERLDPHHGPIAQRHERLVGDPQFASVEAVVQVGLGLQAIAELGVQRGVEDLHRARRSALRAVQRGRCITHEARRGRAGAGERDAGTGRQQQLLLADHHRPGDRPDEPRGQRDRVAAVAQVLAQDRQPVVADPRERVARSDRRVQARGKRRQNVVCCRVAQRLADGAKAIDAERDHRARPLAVAARQHLLDGRAIGHDGRLGQRMSQEHPTTYRPRFTER